MTSYQNNWLAVAGIFLVAFFGLLIWAALKSDSRTTITQTIQNSDTTNVKSILIKPDGFYTRNKDTIQFVSLTDKMHINSILKSLKSLETKHFTKGTPVLWDGTLCIKYDGKFNNGLKDKSQLALRVFDSEEGVFVEMKNVMGSETYSCDDLKSVLEKVNVAFTKRILRQ